MKTYFSYFLLKFKVGLQYRAAAWAGILTQIFFGFIFAFVYLAFYESNNTTGPIEIRRLISYVWLVQAFYAMIYLYHRDKEIIGNIKNGNISYELVRPQNLYAMWFSRILGDKLSSVVLRFLPVLIIASILPIDYRLDLSITLTRFVIFIPALILAAILIVSFIVLMHIVVMFTLDERGVIVIFITIADVLAGTEIPLPFFPKILRDISNFLPFRYMTDFPFRFYVGDISIHDGLTSILVQLVWIIILVVLGKLLMRKALKNAVVQGG